MTSSKRPKLNNFRMNGDAQVIFCTKVNCGMANGKEFCEIPPLVSIKYHENRTWNQIFHGNKANKVSGGGALARPGGQPHQEEEEEDDDEFF